MTDQTIPADAIRAWRDKYQGCTGNNALAALDALLPAPPLPTLADMTEEERKACQWMQSDVANHSVRYVLANPCDEDGEAALVAADGKIRWTFPGYVTPRPDLPRLEWPGDTPAPAPALPTGWKLADHKDYGRVIVTNTTPDEDGHVYFVAPAPAPLGNDWHPCDPGELTYIDTPEDAPPSTLAVGSKWDDADALNRACEESGRDQIVVSDQDGYAFVWDKAAEWWEGSMPPQFIPLTILHTGKKADQ